MHYHYRSATVNSNTVNSKFHLIRSYCAVADPGFSPGGGVPTPKNAIIFQFFAENCIKMKEFGPQGGHASLAPPLGSTNAVNIWQESYHFMFKMHG